MLTDTGIRGVLYIAGGLVGVGCLWGFVKLVSDLYNAILAIPEARDELVKIRELLERQWK